MKPALRTGSKAAASTLLRRLLSLSALAHLSSRTIRTPKKPGHIPGHLLIFFDGACSSEAKGTGPGASAASPPQQGIPRSSVHRAVRAMARAQTKREADAIEIMKKLLGKRLSRQGEHSPRIGRPARTASRSALTAYAMPPLRSPASRKAQARTCSRLSPIWIAPFNSTAAKYSTGY